MTRYKLPGVLGGGEVEADETWSGCAGAQPEYRIGEVTVTMPRGTPMEPVDTTPAEPEPGAWDINGVLCVRFAGDDVPHRWALAMKDAPGGFVFYDWHETWVGLGEPGITPRRLVPEPELPEVTLPWHAYDGDGSLATVSAEGIWVKVAVTENPTGSGDEVAVVEYRADTAERMAAALLRAAREVKP